MVAGIYRSISRLPQVAQPAIYASNIHLTTFSTAVRRTRPCSIPQLARSLAVTAGPGHRVRASPSTIDVDRPGTHAGDKFQSPNSAAGWGRRWVHLVCPLPCHGRRGVASQAAKTDRSIQLIRGYDRDWCTPYCAHGWLTLAFLIELVASPTWSDHESVRTRAFRE
jgi:hypothetical protein